jgi:hypothetical protein
MALLGSLVERRVAVCGLLNDRLFPGLTPVVPYLFDYFDHAQIRTDR